MSRKRKHEVVEVKSSLDIPGPSMNWNLCILCQYYSNEQPLITPSREGFATPISTWNVNGEGKSCTSTRSFCSSSDIEQVCIFCDGSDGVLSATSTLGLGSTIYGNAVQLKDQTLIRKLTSTDTMAREAKYHKPCYRSFLNRVRSIRRSSEQHQIPNLQRCRIWGVPTTEHDVNHTRLKESLLSFIPGLSTDKSGGEVILSSKNDVGDAITDACALTDFSDGSSRTEDGGAIGILDNKTALLKWMVAGPITSQLIGEFEENLFPSGKRIQTLSEYQENTKSFDDRFRRHVDQFIAVLNDQGNPFEGDINDERGLPNSIQVAHENQPFPPSLSEVGRLRKPRNKQDVLACLEFEEIGSMSSFTAMILDGAAVVHLFGANKCKTFADFFNYRFKPYILRSTSRVEIVSDRYIDGSLKNDTREKRGDHRSNVHIRPNLSTIILKNFKNFLNNADNNKQLFNILARQLIQECYTDKEIVCTNENRILTSNNSLDVSNLSTTWHEEADVDSDVLAIAIGVFTKELWIDYGVGQSKRFIAIHDICAKTYTELQSNLPVFHAFTGCDTVSAFCGVGKKTAWKVWLQYREMDGAFRRMCEIQSLMNEDTVMVLERAIENIPPTKDELLQHSLRGRQFPMSLKAVKNLFPVHAAKGVQNSNA
ncbi:hypothetical protein ILUMI_02730 [Ignelater luminosus]|uniref:Uncharacterized protein n=1 Tax=Ignelater luminosus TaxID=2038154 RepID=A0A8K0DC90_IGNLU|nr:hypothetical protein ILUMI_02730 [Ignelater luminosus]